MGAQLTGEFYLDGADFEDIEETDEDSAKIADALEPYVDKNPNPNRMSVRRGDGLPLYFDIETMPDYSRLDSFGLAPVPPAPDETPIQALPDTTSVICGTVDTIKTVLRQFVCPATWLDLLAAAESANKNRAGVHALITEARNVRQAAAQAQVDRLKLLSTTPEYCSICAIGWAVGNRSVESLWICDGTTEAVLLETFWSLAARHDPLICFNGIYFDLPVLMVRSMLLGVPSTRTIDTSPYREDVIDLYLRRFGPRGKTDKERPGKMKDLARLYGIDVPAGDCDGSQVAELMQTAEGRVKVGEYVRSDIHVLREMHKAGSGYFWR